MPLVSTHVIKIIVSYKAYCFSFTSFFIFFVMSNLQYEKLKFCSNIVDARVVICLVELITS